MAQVCFNCGKKAISGNLVSHAKNRIKRRFKPNLQPFWIMEKGKRVRAKFCTKCLRRVKASQKPATPSVPATA
jgi:large subunit ribosomal protein L28